MRTRPGRGVTRVQTNIHPPAALPEQGTPAWQHRGSAIDTADYFRQIQLSATRVRIPSSDLRANTCSQSSEQTLSRKCASTDKLQNIQAGTQTALPHALPM